MNKMHGDSWALFGIKIAVDSHRQSRFTLGQMLFEGHKQFNKWKRKPQSMTAYITWISYLFPAKSKRSYLRHYRVWDKLVVQTRLSQSMLMDFDFTTLAEAAENRYLDPGTLRHIMPKLHAELKQGKSQQHVRRQLKEFAERYHASIPRLIQMIREQDERIKAYFLEQGYYE